MNKISQPKSSVFIDRDGVINFDSPEYIKSPDEWIAIPGSLEAIAALNHAEHPVFVVSNQSGLARHFYDLETLNQIHEKFLKELAEVGGHIDDLIYCPHHPADECLCRKPKPGMLHTLRDRHQLIFENSYLIGDSVADLEAAQAAGCQFLLVLTGNGKKTYAKHQKSLQFPAFENLNEAVQFLLKKPVNF